MIAVKHRTASGNLQNCWEFDVARGVVELVFRLGSASPVAFTVKVCATDNPKVWSHPVMRLDADSWRILPAIWMPMLDGSTGATLKLHPRDCATRDDHGELSTPCGLHQLVGASAHVVLTHAPAAVDFELEGLSVR